MQHLLMLIIIKIKEIAEKLGLIADYVVETGTDGIWTYRKWNSGMAECWTSDQQESTVSSLTALMGGYYGSVTLTLPFKFLTIGNITGNGRTGSGLGWALCSANSSTNATKINVYVCGNQNVATLSYRCNVTGTWK